MWRDLLLIAITIYLAYRWSVEHHITEKIMGKKVYEYFQLKNGNFYPIYFGRDPRTGLRGFFPIKSPTPSDRIQDAQLTLGERVAACNDGRFSSTG